MPTQHTLLYQKSDSTQTPFVAPIVPSEDSVGSEEMKTLRKQAKRKGTGHGWSGAAGSAVAAAVAGVGRSCSTPPAAGTVAVALEYSDNRRSRSLPVPVARSSSRRSRHSRHRSSMLAHQCRRRRCQAHGQAGHAFEQGRRQHQLDRKSVSMATVD